MLLNNVPSINLIFKSTKIKENNKKSGVDFFLMYSHKDIRLGRPNYKLLGRFKTNKIIKAMLWESFPQTKILKGLWRINCL